MEIAEAQDGLFYVDPIVHKDGLDAYFRFESGQATIMIRRFKNTSKASSRTRAATAVTALGLKGRVKEFGESTTTSFPPNFEGLVDVDAWIINLLAPIPIPVKWEGAPLSSPGADVRFAWNLEFNAEDIVAAATTGDINKRLLQFALGIDPPKSEQEFHRRALRKWLRTRVPDITVLSGRVRLSKEKKR